MKSINEEIFKAFEKQYPKKVLNKMKYFNRKIGNCPVCSLELIEFNYSNYCPQCGQRLEWYE